jgi:hypothetical protein
MELVVLEGELSPVGTLGGVVSGGGGVTLLTVTVMGVEVVVLFEVSVAVAVRVCGPLANVVVFQV